ncbi:hypothetical protein QLQ12_28465 [Actinoplanes sp. NEAU-A12]|uniref:Class I SAM-dependent methyltransferase n=1 Tax=Actinoplanes sandaracinus TaxID=3045177 RepID=A0ABT6WSA8_9ACTN|nr:hypothetical protein [Actinoplanes sandaracinus]MDI6102561.1 hypothetical protein [Actinoplanes sandaracinus]
MTPLLLGGEMPHWSDHRPTRGAALRELVRSAHGHVLVAGPHDPELIDAIPARQVTVLVRGMRDAEQLAARWADRPGVRVCCGSLEKLAAVPAYDTVVALDGLDRTGSTETADLSWAAGVARLLAVLRPGGRLVLSCANPVGLHRLYAGAAPPDDAAWGPAAGDDPTRPAGLAALRAHLRDTGLDVLRDYAAYPCPQAPAALLSEAALTDPGLHGFATSALRRAGVPDGPLLADPRPLAAGLLRHTLAAPLAPAWIVVAARPGHHPLPPPDGLLTGGPLRRTSSGWTMGESRATVPTGPCLHDALLAAARGGDQPEFRALLTGWQSGENAAVDADAIIVTAGGLVALAPPSADGDAALRRFAAALHDEGPAELWPAEGTAALLAAMTGRAIGPPPATRAAPETLRELTAAHDRLARELSEARAQSTWYEQRTATLQSDLSRAYRIIAVLKGTTPGRAAVAVLGGVRSGRRLARAALRRLRPEPPTG